MYFRLNMFTLSVIIDNWILDIDDCSQTLFIDNKIPKYFKNKKLNRI